MHEPLYLDDRNLACRIGLSTRHAPSIFAVWEREGFPMIDDMTGKRYWPAVRAWLDRRHGLSAQSVSPKPDGEERWTSQNTTRQGLKPESAKAVT